MSAARRALRVGQRTETGPRPANQDAVLVAELGDGLLAVVADGMGGLEAGEVASRTAVEAFRDAVAAGRPLRAAVQDANRAVLEVAGDSRVGTTLVAAFVQDGQAHVVHVGDSRAYHLGAVGLTQLTRDHTMAAEAARAAGGAGSLAEREVAASRWGGTLTRSLGAGPDVQVDEVGPVGLRPTEMILLTSDGVHGVLSAREMEDILNAGGAPAEVVDALVTTALERGSSDNLSAVLIASGEVRAAAHERPTRKRTPWDPVRLVELSHNEARKRAWVGPGILVWVVVVAVILFVLLLLLG